MHFTREKAGKMLIFGGGVKKGPKMAKIRGPGVKNRGFGGQNGQNPGSGREKRAKIDGLSTGLFLGGSNFSFLGKMAK